MISSEVQRTLVKSPPELWAELSDPAALARHLGELGEIQIVRAEPESTVEWAAENITGTVSIKPSGWGTKVTLSVTRELAAQAPAPTAAPEPAAPPAAAAAPLATEAPPVAEPTAALEPADTPEVAARPAPLTPIAPAAAAQLEPAMTPEPLTAPAPPELEREPRRGFFARLFGRRRRSEPLEPSGETVAAEQSADSSADRTTQARLPEQSDAFAAVGQALAPEIFTAAHPFAVLADIKPAPEPSAIEPAVRAEQVDDISAELMAAEEVTAEEVTAVLTAVLDRLGAAHHRPFSRA